MNKIDFLEKVTKAFKKYDIDIFIDCGTLLGIVRDGSILPWDNDLDFGVLQNNFDHSKIQYLRDYFKKTGFQFYFKNTHIHIIHSCGMYADVNIFKLVNNNYVSENYYPKNSFDKCLYLLYDTINFDYPHKSNSKNYFKFISHQIIILLFSNMKDKYLGKNLSKLIHKRKKDKWFNLSYSIPCKYFSSFESYDNKYLVPHSVEDYLKFKYGEDWKIPNKNWNWSMDLSLINNQT